MSGVVDLIQATVKVEQPLGNGQSTVGTGFIVTSIAPDGAPRTILITAAHVFAGMPHEQATIGFRERDASGYWRYAPLTVRIRGPGGQPLWTNILPKMSLWSSCLGACPMLQCLRGNSQVRGPWRRYMSSRAMR